MNEKKKPADLSDLSVNDWPKKALLALPRRDWDDVEPLYDSLLILSTGKRHESGWAVGAIIGCREGKPVEICTTCSDDIEWKLPPATAWGPNKEYTIGQFRMDCAKRSGALHAWARTGQFRVGHALSSTDITLVTQ